MKTKKLLLLITLLFVSGLSIYSQVSIDADDPLIYYAGRIQYSNPKAPRFAYSGVTIKAKFEGTKVSAILRSATINNYMFVIIDDSIPYKINVPVGETSVLLANNLADTEHTVELFKLTEALHGEVTFKGFELDNGKTLLSLPSPSPRKIEYIGNSITCGYGNEAPTPESGFNADEENHYYSYAAFTSRSLDAQHHAICYSGIGVYRNNGGPIEGSSFDMPSIYHQIYPGSNNWNFSIYQPGVVCINLGTNDFSGSISDYDTALYHSEYVKFINTIRSKYSATKIVLLAGTMMSGEKLEKQKSILNTIVSEFHSEGDMEVYFFEMSRQTGEFGLGGDYHPTVEQHRYNGFELTEYLSKITGWSIHPEIIGADVRTTSTIHLKFKVKMKSPSANFNDFKVLVNKSAINVKSASLSPDSLEIILSLSDKITLNDEVKISYTNGTIASISDNLLKSIYDYPVENKLTETNLLVATLAKSGNDIELVFDKEILLPLTASDIIISATQTSDISVSNVYFDSKYGAQLMHLEINKPILKNEGITISYNANSIFGIDSVPLNPFFEQTVKNDSRYDGTSIKEVEQSAILFPNPSFSAVNVSCNKIIKQIKIYNMYGQLNLNMSDINLNEITLDVGSLHKGVYYITIYTDEKSKETVTFIKH